MTRAAKHPTHEQIMAMPLRQQAVAFEEARHRARLKELEKMGAALLLLEAEYAAIKAAGYQIYPEAIHSVYNERLSLSVAGSVFDGDFRLCKALLIAGFTITKRGEGVSYISAHFKKGRLTIRVSLTPEHLARAEREAAANPAPTAEAPQ